MCPKNGNQIALDLIETKGDQKTSRRVIFETAGRTV